MARNRKSKGGSSTQAKKKKKKNSVKSQPQRVKSLSAPYTVTRVNQTIRNGDTSRTRNAAEMLCALADPFCVVAKGAKIPDGMGLATVPFQYRGHFAFAQVAGPALFFSLNCSPYYNSLTVASYTYPVYTMQALPVTFGAYYTLNTYGQNYRVVTAGVIVRCLIPALTCAGYMIVNRVPVGPVGGGSASAGSVYGANTVTIPLSTGMEVPFLFMPLGSTSKAFSGITNTTNNSGFDTLTFDFYGVPTISGPIIDVEYVYNYEVELSLTNEAISQFCEAKAPDNPSLIQQATQIAREVANGVYPSVAAFGRAIAKSAADRALRRASGRLEDV